jgi:NAD(P)-dependent dehydrogenase (short-subunit alcohol dehydrogenase family)
MARIAIVTGAASSIGQALATRNGRKVGVAGLDVPARRVCTGAARSGEEPDGTSGPRCLPPGGPLL